MTWCRISPRSKRVEQSPVASSVAAKRFLIAVGVSKCKDKGFEPLEEVDGDVERMIELFERFGYTHVRKPLTKGPSSSQLRKAIGEWFSASSRSQSDIVVVFFGGHG